MKKSILFSLLLTGYISASGQISIIADSMVVDKWDVSKAMNVPTARIKENMSMEIDKDLLTLRVFGRAEEKSYIEKAYIITLLELNADKDKWLFQGLDKNCNACTITLDMKNKKISFITTGKDNGIIRPLYTTYYTIADIKINYDAINKHLKEKGELIY